jgi:hypothetical protein
MDNLLSTEFLISPATGLPMVGAVDVAGNPFGCAALSGHQLAFGFTFCDETDSDLSPFE